jgi:hypothetical protein
MTNNRTLRNSLVLSATLLIALALLFGSAPHVRALSRVGNSIPALAAPFAPDAWVQQAAKLTASDLAANDYFGGSIATSGDVVVVGTSRNTCTRAVYVFAKPAGGWSNATQTAKLTPSGVAPCPYFGAVAISGDTIAVGGGAEDAYRGAVFVFVKPPGGWVDMTQTAKLTASDRNDGFDELGASVAIHGDTIVAGAYRDNGERGSSYVFVKPPGGWSNITETAKLTASDSAAGDWFSHSVAISGDTIVVGSYKHNGHRGAAYVFVKPAGTWVNATQTAKLTGTTPGGTSEFGFSVAMDADTIAVGSRDDNASGAAYVFVKPANGWSSISTQSARLTAAVRGGAAEFGHAIGISDDQVIVGAPYQTIGSNYNQGAAYVFVKSASVWANMAETAKLTASDGGLWDDFGYRVAVADSTFAVSAYGDSTGTMQYHGSAYVFTRYPLFLPLILR